LNKVQDEAHRKLDELKILEAERDSIIEVANKFEGDKLPIEFKTKMQENIAKFEEWNTKMQSLRIKSEKINFPIVHSLLVIILLSSVSSRAPGVA
jgi:hypothetical protein